MTRRPEIRVLVVDDDFRVAALHAQFVERVPGFRVLGTAHTAHAAVETARSKRPDLVLLDLYLPDDHGLNVLRKLRDSTGPHPDVIAITAAQDLSSIRTAMQLGVLHYLVKPFAFHALEEQLVAYRELWERSRAGGTVGQRDVDALFGLMRASRPATPLPKGHSEPTMALVREQFEAAEADHSASEIAERIGVSRATAQRYLALLVRSGELDLHLRYGSAGRPEHRYRRAR